MQIFTCQNKCCQIKINPYISEYELPNKIMSNKINISEGTRRRKAGVFIYDPDTDKILLVQSKGNLWGPPKGSIHYNESEKDCAIREVKEETGLDIHIEDDQKFTRIHNKSIYYYVEMTECDVNIQEHIKNNDANGITWITTKCLRECIENGNIALTYHCRIAFKRFHMIDFPEPVFTKVNIKKDKNHIS